MYLSPFIKDYNLLIGIISSSSIIKCNENKHTQTNMIPIVNVNHFFFNVFYIVLCMVDKLYYRITTKYT